MLFEVFYNMFSIFFSFLKFPLYGFVGGIALFYLLVGINVLIELSKGKRFKKGVHIKLKKKSFFRRLFIDFPHRFVLDLFDKEPEFFKFQGMVIFEGRQGNGKTIAMIEFARRMQKEYPKALCLTNLNYKYQDEELDHWRKLIDFKNGINGIIAVMDETQNWFSSNQSKDFPPEMLQVVTQNRKNRRIILGTAQNFYLLAKSIRSQTTEVRRCSTFLGCLTVVRKFEPILDSDGKVKEWKRRGMYFFVHSKELRESYDTYHVINSLAKSGFQERLPDLGVNNFIVNNVKK